ncbi:WD40 repeat domain-containing protein [Streptomyces sp. DSM 15324]|uniref:WD40 repeat domain-containing protein n=1 Tax=Streptomyces sp. DSM 15324 TaxID=1739111 RepID=UPI00131B8423|nr:WD40 repeat domain-containing protein [Streptomyces sp. DSM 15324]
MAALIIDEARKKGADVDGGLLDELALVDWAAEHLEAGRSLQPTRVRQARVARTARAANRTAVADGGTSQTPPDISEGLPGPERVAARSESAPRGPHRPTARRRLLQSVCLGTFAGLGALTTWSSRALRHEPSWSAVRTVAQPEGSQLLSGPVFSPDGSIFAATGTNSSGEAEIYLWRTETGRLLGIMDEGSRFERQAAFSPDGKVLATAAGGPESTVSFWGVDDRRRLAVSDRGMFDRYVIAYSADGKSLVVATTGPGGSVSVWDTALKREVASLPQAPGGASALSVSVDGSALAAVGADGEAKLWALGTRRLRCSVADDKDALNCVAVSADGGLLATGTVGGRVALWNGATGRRVYQAVSPDRPGPVWSLAFCGRPGLLCASIGEHAEVAVWDLSGYRRTWLPAEAEGTMAVSFSPDGRWLAGTRRSEIVLWARG